MSSSRSTSSSLMALVIVLATREITPRLRYMEPFFPPFYVRSLSVPLLRGSIAASAAQDLGFSSWTLFLHETWNVDYFRNVVSLYLPLCETCGRFSYIEPITSVSRLGYETVDVFVTWDFGRRSLLSQQVVFTCGTCGCPRSVMNTSHLWNLWPFH